MRRLHERHRSPARDGSTPDELGLARLAQGGDRRAYDELIRRHYGRAVATACHLVGNREDAEDLVQEAFVKAHRGLASFRGDGSFAGWLRRILVHLARDRFRRAEREPIQASLAAAAGHEGGRDPGAEVRGKELGRLVAEAMGALPENQRLALALRTQDELGYDEVGEALGVTPATARTLVMKARRSLAARLSRYLGGGPA